MPQADGTGPAKLRPLRVLVVDDAEPVVVRFLGPYSGAILHWHAGRSRPCRGEEVCPTHLHAQRSLWKAWAPVEEWGVASQAWYPAVLAITESLEHALRKRHLRGECWVLSCPQLKKKGNPVEGTFVEQIEEKRLRKPFDVVPVLLRMYRCAPFPMGIPNPIPMPEMLTAAQDAGPTFLDAQQEKPVEKPTPEQYAKLREMMGSQRRARKPEAERPTAEKLNGHAGRSANGDC